MGIGRIYLELLKRTLADNSFLMALSVSLRLDQFVVNKVDACLKKVYSEKRLWLSLAGR